MRPVSELGRSRYAHWSWWGLGRGANRFDQEGETKTVDFKDDEPYVIEALLIYLYTFEYPNRKSYKFKEPGRRAAQKMKSKEGVSTRPPSKQETLNSTGFKLKSFAPKETWQEHLAIYHIAHRMNLQSLCKTSLAVLTAHVESALGSASVAHFLKEIYSLPSDKTEGIRKAVANKIANEVPRPIPPTTFDRAMLDHHLFKYDLIKALRQKDLQQRDKIAEQEKKIRAVQQIVSDNWSVKRTYNALIFLTSGWPKAEQS